MFNVVKLKCAVITFNQARKPLQPSNFKTFQLKGWNIVRRTFKHSNPQTFQLIQLSLSRISLFYCISDFFEYQSHQQFLIRSNCFFPV